MTYGFRKTLKEAGTKKADALAGNISTTTNSDITPVLQRRQAYQLYSEMWPYMRKRIRKDGRTVRRFLSGKPIIEWMKKPVHDRKYPGYGWQTLSFDEFCNHYNLIIE